MSNAEDHRAGLIYLAPKGHPPPEPSAAAVLADLHVGVPPDLLQQAALLQQAQPAAADDVADVQAPCDALASIMRAEGASGAAATDALMGSPATQPSLSGGTAALPSPPGLQQLFALAGHVVAALERMLLRAAGAATGVDPATALRRLQDAEAGGSPSAGSAGGDADRSLGKNGSPVDGGAGGSTEQSPGGGGRRRGHKRAGSEVPPPRPPVSVRSAEPFVFVVCVAQAKATCLNH